VGKGPAWHALPREGARPRAKCHKVAKGEVPKGRSTSAVAKATKGIVLAERVLNCKATPLCKVQNIV
jgi:hypothetical protein